MPIEIRDSSKILKKIEKGTLIEVLYDIRGIDNDNVFYWNGTQTRVLNKGYHVLHEVIYKSREVAVMLCLDQNMSVTVEGFQEHSHDWLRVVDSPNPAEKVLYGRP